MLCYVCYFRLYYVILCYVKYFFHVSKWYIRMMRSAVLQSDQAVSSSVWWEKYWKWIWTEMASNLQVSAQPDQIMNFHVGDSFDMFWILFLSISLTGRGRAPQRNTSVSTHLVQISEELMFLDTLRFTAKQFLFQQSFENWRVFFFLVSCFFYFILFLGRMGIHFQFETHRTDKRVEPTHSSPIWKVWNTSRWLQEIIAAFAYRVLAFPRPIQVGRKKVFRSLFQRLFCRTVWKTSASDACCCTNTPDRACVEPPWGQETPLNQRCPPAQSTATTTKKKGVFLFKEPGLETSGSQKGKVWGSTLGLLFHKSHMWIPPLDQPLD